MNAPFKDALASRATREQVADLLYRYPNVSDSDAKTILTFLRKGRHLDVGILTADEHLRQQLDLFMQAHAKHFRVGLGEAATVIAAIGGFLIVCWLIWEALRPGALCLSVVPMVLCTLSPLRVKTTREELLSEFCSR